MLANDLSFDPLIAEIPLVFINEGKTTAFIKTLKVEHAIAEYEAPLKGQGRGTEIDYDGETVSPGAKLETVMGLGFYINSKDAIYIIENGGVALWYFGYLEYRDFFGKTHYSHFCYDYNLGVGCGTPYGGEKKNYLT